MTTMPEHEAENDNARGSDYSRISRDTTCKTTCLYGCFNALQLLHAINAALVDFSNRFLSCPSSLPDHRHQEQGC